MKQEQKNKIELQTILGQIIKKYRLERKKSISLISAEIGMTKSMWADMEKGIKDPQFSTLFRMSEGLDISLVKIIKELYEILPEDFTFDN